MMFNNLSKVPQCILIFNPAQNNGCIDISSQNNFSIKTQNGKKNNTRKCNGKNTYNMNAICNPCLLINQNSLPFTVNLDIIAENQSESILKRNPFTYEEDELLQKLVESYGTKDWKTISILMKKCNFNRNLRQCKDRYFHYLDPKIKQKIDWTEDEENLLLSKVAEMGNKWKAMESYFPGRTEISLRNRYKLLLRKESKDERKKKNIMSDEYSFLDKINAKNSKNIVRKNKDYNEILQEENEEDDLVKNETNKYFSTTNFDHDILFENELEQESQVWIDEELNGYF